MARFHCADRSWIQGRVEVLRSVHAERISASSGDIWVLALWAGQHDDAWGVSSARQREPCQSTRTLYRGSLAFRRRLSSGRIARLQSQLRNNHHLGRRTIALLSVLCTSVCAQSNPTAWSLSLGLEKETGPALHVRFVTVLGGAVRASPGLGEKVSHWLAAPVCNTAVHSSALRHGSRMGFGAVILPVSPRSSARRTARSTSPLPAAPHAVNVCQNTSARITIRYTGSINGKPIFESLKFTEIKTVPYVPLSHRS